MSLTLETYPVYFEGINKVNVFPGFKAIDIVFKREDLAITTVTQAADNRIQINVGTDVTSELNEGDFVYLYSEGVTYTYDLTAEVISVTASAIVIDGDYIEGGTGGYTNYKQNYAVEMKLTDPDNFAIDLLGFTLKQSGSDSGNIIFDVSVINDLNCQEFVEQLTGREVEEGRVKFNVKYREIWREDDTASYIEIDNPIIALFATSDFQIETFSNPFSEPFFYAGYPAGIGFIHSDSNQEDDAIKVTFDELDINKTDITTGNVLKQFNITDYGVLLATSEDTNLILNEDTKYIRLNASIGGLPEYEPTEYSNEYNIVV